MTAECQLELNVFLPKEQASTRPRSDDRGVRMSKAIPPKTPNSFNEAAVG